LYLSTDNDETNKNLIASVASWTNSREWGKFPSQQSAPISLVAGTEYYIEALMKEGGGGDNFAVGWQLPDATMERPIPGSYLSPYTNTVTPLGPAGEFVMENGNAMQVGLVNATTSWQTINFDSPFASTPIVLSQIASVNDASAVITRIRNVSTTSFEVLIQEESANDGVHAAELVHWVAMEKGIHTSGGSRKFVADNTGTVIDWNDGSWGWHWVNYGLSWTDTKAIFADYQTYNDATPYSIRSSNLDNEWGWSLISREDVYLADWMAHPAEDAGYFVSRTGNLLDDTGQIIGEIIRVNHATSSATDWDNVAFANSYVNPIIIAKPASFVNDENGDVRISNITSVGCQIQFDEWDSYDGVHPEETFSIMVIDGENLTVVAPPTSGGGSYDTSDISVGCDSIPAAPTYTYSDNCSSNVTFNYVQDSVGSGCNYILTRTWSAEDECNNVNEIVQQISVSDSIAPIFLVAPALQFIVMLSQMRRH